MIAVINKKAWLQAQGMYDLFLEVNDSSDSLDSETIFPESVDELTYPDVKNSVDSRLLPLVEECEREGVPVPDCPFELANATGQVVAQADLAWPMRKVAVLNAERISDRKILLKAGWRVMTHLDRHEDILKVVA